MPNQKIKQLGQKLQQFWRLSGYLIKFFFGDKELSRLNYASILVVEALAPCIARSSAAMILTVN